MLKKVGALIYLFVFIFSVHNFCWAQNIAPILTASGNQAYCPNSQINIVTDFDIVDPDDTSIEALYVQISTGYSQGEDLLLLTGSHPNVLTSWNVLEGKLTLFGVASAPVSYIDLIAATKDIIFQSTSNNPIDKFFSITIGDANYLPLTDHYYEYVPFLGITWTSAKIEAENRTYFGLQGYLATITSAEEAQLSGEQASGAGWIGGSDEESEGVWKWVTGPETGIIFWNGLTNGFTQNYANWNTGEPNQAGNEDYAHITDPSVGILGAWNDLPNAGDTSGPYQPKGYMVEYGGMPGDPILNIAASTSIYTSSIVDTTSGNICGSGTTSLEAVPSVGDVLWFDTPTGGNVIFSGQIFTTPIINTTTTYYALASINGCTEGIRVPVTAIVTPMPTIISVNDSLICNSGTGTLSAVASAGVINWYDLPSGGTSLNTGSTFNTPNVNSTTSYYVDATVNGCITSTRTPVTLTVQKTTSPTTTNTNQSFCDIEQATVLNIDVVGTSVLWYTSNVGGVSIDESTPLITNTTYYATQTINGCESVNRLPITIIINETVVLPSSSEIPDLNICDNFDDGDDTNGYATFDLTINETILLNGKLASNYTFNYFTDSAYNNPINTASTFVNTIQDRQLIYVRIVNNSNNGCYTDTAFEVNVNALPIIQPSIVFKNCDEDGVADGFTNFNLEEANDIITGDNSLGLTISYYASLNDANNASNSMSSIFNNQNGSIVYARFQNANGCFRVSEINLQVSTTSFPNGYFEELEFCDDTVDGFLSFDLTQVTPLFINQFPTGQNLRVQYYENLNDALLEENEIIQQDNFTNTTPFSQILYVRVESDDNGECFGIGPHLVLTVNPKPEFEVDNSEIYCLDNNPITLSTFNPKGNYSYEWKDNTGQILSNSSTVEVLSGGEYTVSATSNLGCTSFPVTFDVVESAIAIIDLEDITIIELSDNNSITINNDNNNLGIGDYRFSLDNFNGPYRDEPFFDRVGAGSHIIYVKDKNGCGITSIEVFILGFPKYFTPNNDGVNDTWLIKGLGSDYTDASKVSVFNRYGQLIKQLTSKSGAWDGTFNGEILPQSDYWFVAELVDISGNIKTYKGHFSLVR